MEIMKEMYKHTTPILAIKLQVNTRLMNKKTRTKNHNIYIIIIEFAYFTEILPHINPTIRANSSNLQIVVNSNKKKSTVS